MSQKKFETKQEIAPRKMTKQEIKEWDDLYQYVRSEIFQYSSDMALSKHMVMRLKGLREGKFYANKNAKSMGDYSYSIILLTFKFCKQKILNALAIKRFKNEQNKINYIMVIIESNINDVVLRLKNVRKTEEAIKATEVVDYEIKVDKNNSAKKSDKKDNQIFNSLTDNLW